MRYCQRCGGVLQDNFTHYCPSNIISNGAYCGSCGAWTPTGSFHICSGSAWYNPYPYYFIDNRVIEILERIAKSLEQITGKK